MSTNRSQRRQNYSVSERISSLSKNMSFGNNTTIVETQVKDNENYAFFSPEADIFPLLLAVLIIIVNTWVIVLVTKKMNLRNITNYILCSLAVSDLLTGYLSIPMYVICNVIRNTPTCLMSDVFLRFTSISTVAHLLAVTVDRYVAIMYSLRYSILVTKTRAFVAIVFIWLMSVVMSLIHFSWQDPTDHDVSSSQTEEQKNHEIRYDIFCLVNYFVLPFLFMIFAYGRIFYQVIRQRKIMTRNNLPCWNEPPTIIDKYKWKAAVIFVVMLLVYMICWMPYFLYRLQYNFKNESYTLPVEIQYFIVYLRFCTSLFNPLLYILGKQDFRKAILQRFERRGSRSLGVSSTMRTTFV